MTSLQIIKDELARIDEARAKATQGKWQVSEESFFEVWTFPETNLIAKLSPKDDFSFGKTSCFNNSEFIALAANEISNLTKALSVAVSKLDEIDKALRVPAAEYVPAISDAFAIIDNSYSSIANILSGGKDGK